MLNTANVQRSGVGASAPATVLRCGLDLHFEIRSTIESTSFEIIKVEDASFNWPFNISNALSRSANSVQTYLRCFSLYDDHSRLILIILITDFEAISSIILFSSSAESMFVALFTLCRKRTSSNCLFLFSAACHPIFIPIAPPSPNNTKETTKMPINHFPLIKIVNPYSKSNDPGETRALALERRVRVIVLIDFMH